MLGMPVPPEWREYVRGINPIFMSAFGGHEAWISFYLPVHSAFRALVSFFADPELTSPLFLAVGFGALWHIARNLFPGDRTSTRLNSSHYCASRMPSSA